MVTPIRTVRIDAELWERAVTAVDSDPHFDSVSDVIRTILVAYVKDMESGNV